MPNMFARNVLSMLGALSGQCGQLLAFVLLQRVETVLNRIFLREEFPSDGASFTRNRHNAMLLGGDGEEIDA